MEEGGDKFVGANRLTSTGVVALGLVDVGGGLLEKVAMVFSTSSARGSQGVTIELPDCENAGLDGVEEEAIGGR